MLSKVKFIQNGNTVNVIEFNEEQVKDVLGNKVYMLCYSNETGFYLTYVKDKFDLPEKLYGSTNQRAERILKSFNNGTKGTGVLCTGDKGSGKTLLMSKVCNDSGLPVILINSCYTGSQFELFINRLGKCVLLFDEFGKTYKRTDDGEPQEEILSLLDGSTSNKRLVLMTENDTFLINDFILGRGGRVRYHFEYTKLEEDVISQYCNERECSNEFTSSVIDFCRTSSTFSFDTLVTLVNEHKEFGEKLEEFLPFINVDGRNKSKTVYLVAQVIDNVNDKDITSLFGSKMIPCNYDSDDLYLEWTVSSEDKYNRSFNIYSDFVSKADNQLVLSNDAITVVMLETQLKNKKFDHRAF